MTSNPLARRRTEPGSHEPLPWRTPQEHVDYLNARCTRPDLEWVLGENGPFIRDKPSWTAARLRAAEAKVEADRARWKRAQYRAGEN